MEIHHHIGVKKNGTKIEVFHKHPDTQIKLYDIDMRPIAGASPYGWLRTRVINLMRKHSGTGALINQDALEGYRGSAAMIDYVLRFVGHPNGKLDRIFLTGSSDAVRSRVKIVQDELFDIAKSNLEEKGTFHLFEVGPGYLRTQLNLLDRLKKARYDVRNVKMVGADLHPGVVKAASQIIQYEGIGDMVTIHEGDAKHCLEKLNMTFDAVLAEGVFEYSDMQGSTNLARTLGSYLRPQGHLMASATHAVPKKLLIEYLDILLNQRTREEFVQIYKHCGFEEPRLIATEPPNISVGIGQKRGES
ncbi:MAG: class I SAM-dependent methyltransferase [Anaerolineae bacterium]|nr:class I SAM-dependent methyltransferase [Anaerolineae bacterium]